MKKKIFYWGPFLDNKVATVKAIKNSVFSINNYSIYNHYKKIEKILKNEN